MIQYLLSLTSYQLSVVQTTLKAWPSFTFTSLGSTLVTLKAATEASRARLGRIILIFSLAKLSGNKIFLLKEYFSWYNLPVRCSELFRGSDIN